MSGNSLNQTVVPKSYLKQRLIETKSVFAGFASANNEKFSQITRSNLKDVMDQFHKAVAKAIDDAQGSDRDVVMSLDELTLICNAISAIKKETADGIFKNRPGLSKIALTFRQLVDTQRDAVLAQVKTEFALPQSISKLETKVTRKPDSIFSNELAPEQTIEKAIGRLNNMLLAWHNDALTTLHKVLGNEDEVHDSQNLDYIAEILSVLIKISNQIKENLETRMLKNEDVTFAELQDFLMKAFEAGQIEMQKRIEKCPQKEIKEACSKLNFEAVSLALCGYDIKQFNQLPEVQSLGEDVLSHELNSVFLPKKQEAITKGNGARAVIRAGVAEHEYYSQTIASLGAESAEAIPYSRLKKMTNHANRHFHGGLDLRDAGFIKNYAQGVIEEQRDKVLSAVSKLDQLDKSSVRVVADVIDALFNLSTELTEIDQKLAECEETEIELKAGEKEHSDFETEYTSRKKKIDALNQNVAAIREKMARTTSQAMAEEELLALGPDIEKLRLALNEIRVLETANAELFTKIEAAQEKVLTLSDAIHLKEKNSLISKKDEIKALLDQKLLSIRQAAAL